MPALCMLITCREVGAHTNLPRSESVMQVNGMIVLILKSEVWCENSALKQFVAFPAVLFPQWFFRIRCTLVQSRALLLLKLMAGLLAGAGCIF